MQWVMCKVKLFWGGRKTDGECVTDLVMGGVFSGVLSLSHVLLCITNLYLSNQFSLILKIRSRQLCTNRVRGKCKREIKGVLSVIKTHKGRLALPSSLSGVYHTLNELEGHTRALMASWCHKRQHIAMGNDLFGKSFLPQRAQYTEDLWIHLTDIQ